MINFKTKENTYMKRPSEIKYWAQNVTVIVDASSSL